MLHQKVALVTGGGSGIGRATAIALAEAGASVGLCDIDPKAGTATKAAIETIGGNAVFVATDVGVPSEARAFVEEVAATFGRVDILVNNAGITHDPTSFEAFDWTVWKRVLSVNLDGHFLCARAAVPHMIAAGGGAIVNTGSVLAEATLPGRTAYSTSKAAVLGFTKVLALDLGRFGIRVNCLVPGSTDTAMMWRGLSAEDQPAAAKEAGRAQPIGRIAGPEEIAQATVFLVSPKSSFVTGTTLVVDGGLLTQIATTR